MNVTLKVVQGKLKNRRGDSAGMEVKIRKQRFVVGSAEDCHMRCQSRTVSSYHCEFLVSDETVGVRDLDSESGTFVNDQPVGELKILTDGDFVRIGKLEFEVAIDLPKKDKVSDFVSEMLVEADEEERARRLQDPRTRQFEVESGAVQTAEVADEKKQPARPTRKPPGKLPPPPKYVAESSTAAAEDILKQIFEKPKG